MITHLLVLGSPSQSRLTHMQNILLQLKKKIMKDLIQIHCQKDPLQMENTDILYTL